MKRLLSSLLASFTNSPKRCNSLSHKHQVRLGVECLERRELMSVSPPATPVFTATAVSATQINLTWKAVSGATDYVIDELKNGVWTQLPTVGSTSTSYAVTGLPSSTTVWFDVAAINTAGASPWATPKSATTLATAPAAPSFTTTAVSATQINLTWNAVSGATGYLVDVWKNGAWTTITLGSGATSYAVTGLSRATPYTFDVAATNSAGTTWAKSMQNAITLYNPTTSAVNDPYLPAPTYSPAPASATLFGPSGLPSPTDVAQGYEGDCWLIASLAEVAARAPQDIVNMFHYVGSSVENGAVVQLYTVRFYNSSGVAQYVTVDTELPNGGTYYDRVQTPLGGQVLWVALAEKAYAEANGLGYVTSQHPGIDSYDALNGGYPQWPLQAITNKPANNYSFNSSNLAAAWNAGDMIVLSSDSTPNSPYIVGTHAYAVVGYNGSSFEVLNPWGTTSTGMAPETNANGHSVYGEYWLSAAFLSQNFAQEALGSGAMALDKLI